VVASRGDVEVAVYDYKLIARAVVKASKVPVCMFLVLNCSSQHVLPESSCVTDSPAELWWNLALEY